MARVGLGRGLASPLLLINFFLYVVSAGLASWALNRNLNAASGHGPGPVGNNVTTGLFLPVALLACVLGFASTIAGIYHLKWFRRDSLAAAAATSATAWALVFLAFILACKEINKGGFRPKRLKVVEAFIIILFLLELLHFLALHVGSEIAGHNRKDAAIATGAGAGAGTTTGGYAGTGTTTGGYTTTTTTQTF